MWRRNIRFLEAKQGSDMVRLSDNRIVFDEKCSGGIVLRVRTSAFVEYEPNLLQAKSPKTTSIRKD